MHILWARLGKGLPPSVAMSRAIARLPRLTRTQALVMLARVASEPDRAAAEERLGAAPDLGLFSEPYVSGGYAVHGLL
jgi:hypothetical protein